MNSLNKIISNNLDDDKRSFTQTLLDSISYNIDIESLKKNIPEFTMRDVLAIVNAKRNENSKIVNKSNETMYKINDFFGFTNKHKNYSVQDMENESVYDYMQEITSKRIFWTPHLEAVGLCDYSGLKMDQIPSTLSVKLNTKNLRLDTDEFKDDILSILKQKDGSYEFYGENPILLKFYLDQKSRYSFQYIDVICKKSVVTSENKDLKLKTVEQINKYRIFANGKVESSDYLGRSNVTFRNMNNNKVTLLSFARQMLNYRVPQDKQFKILEKIYTGLINCPTNLVLSMYYEEFKLFCAIVKKRVEKKELGPLYYLKLYDIPSDDKFKIELIPSRDKEGYYLDNRKNRIVNVWANGRNKDFKHKVYKKKDGYYIDKNGNKLQFWEKGIAHFEMKKLIDLSHKVESKEKVVLSVKYTQFGQEHTESFPHGVTKEVLEKYNKTYNDQKNS